MSFKASANMVKLRSRLETMAVGEVVKYEDLAALISVKKVAGSFPALSSARRSLLNKKQMVFECINGTELRRLTDAQIITASSRDIQSVRNKSHFGMKKLKSAKNVNALPNADQLRHSIRLQTLSILHSAAKKQKQKKLEEKTSTISAAKIDFVAIRRGILGI